VSDLTTYQIIAQAVGILASGFVISGWSSKKDKKLKIILCCGAFLFAVHFYMLGAFAAMIVSAINILRIGLSLKFHKSNALCLTFIISYLIAGFITYQSPIDILPIISSSIGTISMYLLSGVTFRYISMIPSLSWLTHNIIVMSIGGIITEIFVLIGLLSAIIRIKSDNKKALK